MFRAHARTQGFFPRKSANLPQRGFITLKHKRICMLQICGRLSKMWQIMADCGDYFWEKVHFPSSIIQLYTLSQSTSHVKTLHGVLAYTPRSIGLHSTEHRLTLHGASAYTPRSIGLHSTEHRATLHGVFFYTAVRGKACALQLMLISIGLPDEKQLMGAYSKVPKGRETTDGGASPR